MSKDDTKSTTDTPAEVFRSAVANAGFTVVDDVPDDLTEEQLVALLEEMLQQMRANVSTKPAHRA